MIEIYSEWNDEVKSLAKAANKEIEKLNKEISDLRFFINELYNVREEKRRMMEYRGF